MAVVDAEFSLRETRPNIGRDRVSGDDNLRSSYDLVEQMEFLYVRIVEPRDLPVINVNGIIDPYIEIKIGNYVATNKYSENSPDLKWNQVFAFERDRLQDTIMVITVRDKAVISNDNMIGKIKVTLAVELPTCLPPDSPLAATWRKLEDKNGEYLRRGELLYAAWFSTQADREFRGAWHSNSAIVSGESLLNTVSMAYTVPKLWYLRVNVIQAQDLVLHGKDRDPEVFVKAVVGDVILRTRISPDKDRNPRWNEDLMFVVAEPFEDPLIVTVEDWLGNNTIRHLGKCIIHLSKVEERVIPEPAAPIWENLEHNVSEDGVREEMNFYSKLNLKLSLDGGYHVFDECIHIASDFRPTAKGLWGPRIGVLEVGIISATGLQPMKIRNGREATDAYCVAKYGPKWVRTRTAVNSFHPRWNEQCTWDVYEPSTMFTIGVFDDCHLHDGDAVRDGKDPSLGRVRIRISTLEKNKIHTHSYPILVLQPNGVRKMGEIQLAIRFTCTSYKALLNVYTKSRLPQMHFIFPLSIFQLDYLRKQTVGILCSSLSRTEPPLRKEVVEYMLDGGSQMWSQRKAKANYFRNLANLDCVFNALEWFDGIRKWKNPVATVFVIVMYGIFLYDPNLIWQSVIAYMIWFSIIQWSKPHRQPAHLDVNLSVPSGVTADEVDEGFDTFPSSVQSEDVLRMRYDRLRNVSGNLVKYIGDIAKLLERFQSLVNWSDKIITAIFLVYCLLGIIMSCYLSINCFKWFLFVGGVYAVKGPLIGNDVPNAVQNIFRRLHTKEDIMLYD